jgi:hypothetical protein
MTRLLIVGVPRSGTSWVARTLRRTEGACFVGEPDNEKEEPFALAAKHGLGLYPVLQPGDESPACETLWERAFAGRKRGSELRTRAAKRLLQNVSSSELRAAVAHSNYRLSPRLRAVRLLAAPPSRQYAARHVVVKSVFAPLAVEWIAQRYRPRILVMMRNPLNVIASWLDLNYQPWPLDTHPVLTSGYLEELQAPPPQALWSRVTHLTWEMGVLMSALETGARRNPEWLVVQHEDICVDPQTRFSQICGEVGLEWNERAASFLDETNKPGTGYAVERITGDQPDRWRRRLDDQQVAEISAMVSAFPLLVERFPAISSAKADAVKGGE